MAEGFFLRARKETEAPSLNNDNHTTIDLANNPVDHDRTKHIDM